jgi:hypothetical protein
LDLSALHQSQFAFVEYDQRLDTGEISGEIDAGVIGATGDLLSFSARSAPTLIGTTLSASYTTLFGGLRLGCDGHNNCAEVLTFDTGSATADPISGLRDFVPEPSAWCLMIAGFGLAGAALRRRRALA